MLGMNANTGESLEGIDHLRQSVNDILTTPIGSRIMRRDYGSRLFALLDRPMNQALLADIQVAIVMALSMQEPRIRLSSVNVRMTQAGEEGLSDFSQGKIIVDIEGYYHIGAELITLENMLF